MFLHPQTKEEYALARTERKTARGYHGFEFHAAPDVTLEDDLARRDLTINAIARDADGKIIDPFGGAADLKARVLRHVGPAFAEDPVRILRVARFAARFGFAIAPETMRLMREMVAQGEAAALVAERVWQELGRGLMERQPSRMFRVLAECGASAVVLPELTTDHRRRRRARVDDAGRRCRARAAASRAFRVDCDARERACDNGVVQAAARAGGVPATRVAGGAISCRSRPSSYVVSRCTASAAAIDRRIAPARAFHAVAGSLRGGCRGSRNCSRNRAPANRVCCRPRG